MPAPQVGAVVGGYRFKGGNPNDRASWEPVKAGPPVGTEMGGYRFIGGDPNAQKSWAPIEAEAPEPRPTLKEPEGGAPMPWDYLLNREEAIKRDREYRAYLQERQQQELTKDIKTQTGFFDRLGDLFQRGELSVTSGIKDVEAAIESDPTLKKQYQAEARRFAEDASTPIAGEVTWEEVKKHPLKVLPYILEQGAQSIPQMIVGRMSPLGMAVNAAGVAGQVGRGRAEADERQDVSGTDIAIGAPVGVISTLLDQFGLGEILGTAGKNAVVRTLKAAGAEGSTETIQNTLEYLGSRVGTVKGADAKEAFDQAMAAFVAGGGLGGGLRGTGEVAGKAVSAVKEKLQDRAAKQVADQLSTATPPAVRQEFQRLASQEIATIMSANPDMDQNAATAAVAERGEELLAQATQNVAAATGGEGYEGGVGAGLDVSGGIEPSVPDVGEFGGAPIDTGAPSEAVTGRLGEPDLGVPVSDVGQGAQPGTLGVESVTAEPAPKPAFDTTPVFEATALKDRKSAADMLVSDVVQATPELQGLDKKTYNTAATQMAKSAARGEQFDPVEVMYNVAGIEPAAMPETAAPEAVAPETAVPEAVAPEMAAPETVAPKAAAPAFEEPQFTPETLPEPDIYESNPGGDWEARKQATAEQEQIEALEAGEDIGTAARMLSGSTTQTIRRVEIPVEKLRTLEGVNKEQPAPGEPKYDALRKSVDENGFDRKKAGLPMVWVNHKGEAFLYEGNNRVAVAAEEGVKTLPVEIQYRNGAEKVPGAFAPDQVLAEHQAMAAPAAPAAPTVAMAAPQAAPAAPQGGTEPIDTTTVDKAVAPKLTKTQIKKLEEAAGIRRMKITNMQKRILRSRNAEDTMGLVGRLMLMARNPDEDVGLLTSLFNSVPPPVLQKLLGPMLTEDVVRLGDRAGMKGPAKIDALMRDGYLPYVNRIMQRASKVADEWADFTSRSEEGALALADTIFVTNMYNVDPSLAANATEYGKLDPELQELLDKQATTTDPAKLKTLKQQIGKRRGEIQRVYYGGADEATGETVRGWTDVPPQGKKLFRMARDEYKATFDEHYRLLMERIDDMALEEADETQLKDAVERMFAKARERVVYFPLKRFGEYWVTVGKGKDGEFHLFETASEQDAFLAQLRQDKETRTVSSGFGRDTLRNLVGNKDASAALKGVLDMIDETGGTDIDLLKDHIFQMYLTALPEGDMRRRFINRQFKTGFSTDVLRTFASTAVASANQLGRLAYGYKFKNAIDESYAETEGKASKRRLDTITRELQLRVDGTLSPEDGGGLDWLLSLGAKGTFLFLLSSPKSAIMNLTQLHIAGLPTLSAEFGEKATYGMAARYTGSFLTGQRIANPFRDADGNVRLQMPDVTLENSAYIQGLKESDPERYAEMQKAWQYQAEHDVTESTFAAGSDIYERSSRPTEKYSFTQAARKGDVITAAQRGTANAIEAMGALFHHGERIGREIMFMSAFELAYERGLKQGKTSEQAGEEARVLAAKLTNKGMFDFSNWNKSRYSKSQAGRLPLQMRSYSLAMTSLLFRSFVNMVALQRTKAERLAAARVFMGVGAMTTLYGGFRVSQFYVMAMLGYGFYEFLKDMLGDEDEPEDEVAGGYLNEDTIQRELLKYADEKGRELSKKDMEYYVRAAWIPETFGRGGTLATALGIEDKNADKLARAADMGIPALFNVDISNSVSLGDLWHPVEAKSQDPEARFYERVGRVIFGPSGALISGGIKAVKEANDGNIDKAIEATMPALIRNFVKAERLKEEGLVVGKNRDVVLQDPSFYDTLTLVLQSAGFTEAETSRAMQMDIKASDIEKEISAEQTKLLDRRYRAILDFNKDPTPENEKAWKTVERDISIYNLNYPSNEITEDDKEKSFQNKINEAAERAGGLGYNPKIPVRQIEAEERAARLYEEQ